MSFEKFKSIRYENHSDISEHLPFLERIARKCEHITEFGVRNAVSTTAFLTGALRKVVSYDINITPAVEELKSMELPCEWEFIHADTTDPNLIIEDTDFLFVDTLHTYNQVETELRLHGHKAKRFIGFHDIASQGAFSVDVPGEEGINRAIEEYMSKTDSWKKIYEVYFNNGLLIIERKGN